jgi:hypothetical protein
MAIKKLTVSFDLPVATFLSMLAAGNSGMKIDVFGDEPKTRKLLNGHAPRLAHDPKLIEATPQRHARRGRGIKTAYRAMFDLFAERPDYKFKPVELQPAVVAAGLSYKSVSPQLHRLRKHGNVKRHGDATYQITARGAKLVASETVDGAT